MSEIERNYEQEAHAQGWRPQEEFSGDPEKWVDAKTFVDRGDKYVGIMKDRYDKLEKRLKDRDADVETIKNQYKRLEQDKAREIDGLIKQLESQRKTAVTNGDGEAFDRAEKELVDAKAAKQQIEQSPSGPQPQWAKEWMSENEWYGKDRAATVLAETFSEELRKAQPWLGEREFMDKVTEYVQTELPHKFENPKKKQKNPDVEIGGNPPGGPAHQETNTYNALPADAKKEFNRLVKENLFKATDEDRVRFTELYNS